MYFVIRWNWCGSGGPYIIAKPSSLRGYTENLSEAKKWTTYARAERYLRLKDPGWAAKCVIEKIDGKN